METERLRSTLLSSVSHDLRTPLAAITGAASTCSRTPRWGTPARRELHQAIYDEAVRLNRLVTNLLDMTRLESGSLQINRDWHSVEELVGSALARLERRPEGPCGPARDPGGPAPRARRRRAGRAGPREPPRERDEVHRPDAAIEIAARADGASRWRWRTRGRACPRGRRSGSSRSSTGPSRRSGASAWVCPFAGPSSPPTAARSGPRGASRGGPGSLHASPRGSASRRERGRR